MFAAVDKEIRCSRGCRQGDPLQPRAGRPQSKPSPGTPLAGNIIVTTLSWQANTLYCVGVDAKASFGGHCQVTASMPMRLQVHLLYSE